MTTPTALATAIPALSTLLPAILAASLVAGCASQSADTTSTASLTPAYACNTATQGKANDLRIYQIMVESFVDGEKGTGHGTGYGTSHHQGDLQGIIDSLDYIKSLGMNAIWMTPIFNSEPVTGQEHWDDRLDATGYFATDYFSIDPRFGTLEQAKELVEKAHAKGLYVLFDGVFGHHKKSVVVPSPSGLLPSGSHNPVDYPDSLPFYKEVATHWIKELKIDGWRLDQAYQVPTEAWTEIRKAVDKASRSVTCQNDRGETVHPLGYMVAEIWKGENTIQKVGYGTGENPALCSAFDFPMRYRLVETFAVNENGMGGKGGDWLDEGMNLHSLYPKHAQPNLMLGNHDVVRFGDLLQRGGIANPEDPQYWLRHKAALSFMAAYTGPITLYYGDEIGDETPGFAERQPDNNCAIRGMCDDHSGRTSGKIDGLTVELNKQQHDLKAYVSSLMALRDKHPALSKGERINIRAVQEVYIDHKQSGDDALIYMVSTDSAPQLVALTTVEAGSEGRLVDLLTGEVFFPKNNQYAIPMKGFEARFLGITNPAVAGPKVNKRKADSMTGEGFLARCDNPTVNEAGPAAGSLYVVGSFPDSNWIHKPARAFKYKGNGVYQTVTSEQKGSYRFQYATANWSPQYTAVDLLQKPGQPTAGKKGGYGTDTSVMIPEAGRYVWSLTFRDSGEIDQVMVSRCMQ
ncbi:alpha-amylase family glycosyl hydrolase [Endozoicomonas sp. ONNA2]|uniref:alpha-amylase family glycosyl hydrolase n=1 Tax=Endozoicomonas sp. ONNA2 TaxID=2828741 RepID=UPI0021489C29|nr:alpha-amylase family glycosyl hydrolase [Endozoicomonas sp. ONNA2]